MVSTSRTQPSTHKARFLQLWRHLPIPIPVSRQCACGFVWKGQVAKAARRMWWRKTHKCLLFATTWNHRHTRLTTSSQAFFRSDKLTLLTLITSRCTLALAAVMSIRGDDIAEGDVSLVLSSGGIGDSLPFPAFFLPMRPRWRNWAGSGVKSSAGCTGASTRHKRRRHDSTSKLPFSVSSGHVARKAQH